MAFLTKNDAKSLAVFGVVSVSAAFMLGYFTDLSMRYCALLGFLIGTGVEFGFRRILLHEDRP